MKLKEILNLNKYKMRHKDKYVVILKSGETCFTLGETYFHAWICGELDLTSFRYTEMCLDEEVSVEIINKIDYKLYKLYIDNEDLQADIYLLEDTEYNRRIK